LRHWIESGENINAKMALTPIAKKWARRGEEIDHEKKEDKNKD
jgi:hypothetical protein